MRIQVADLPAEPVVLTHSWPESWVGEVLGDGTEFRPATPCEISVEATLVDQTLMCRGEIACRATGSCMRCLGEMDVDLGGRFELVLEARRLPEDWDVDEDDAEDMGFAFYDGNTADLEPYVREQLALGVPMQAVCDDECKGLCAQCGKNLNDGPCGCESP